MSLFLMKNLILVMLWSYFLFGDFHHFFTYIRTDHGFLYLTGIIDLLCKTVVSCSFSTTMFVKDSVIAAWEMANIIIIIIIISF